MRLLAATVALACALCILPLSASGLSFTLEGSERRCLQEDVNDNALILGEYEVTDHPLVDVLLQVCGALRGGVGLTWARAPRIRLWRRAAGEILRRF